MYRGEKMFIYPLLSFSLSTFTTRLVGQSPGPDVKQVEFWNIRHMFFCLCPFVCLSFSLPLSMSVRVCLSVSVWNCVCAGVIYRVIFFACVFFVSFDFECVCICVWFVPLSLGVSVSGYVSVCVQVQSIDDWKQNGVDTKTKTICI